MRRLICVVLLGCLATASVIPLPGPGLISEEDIINMILNAKPEDNDIEFNRLDSQSTPEELGDTVQGPEEPKASFDTNSSQATSEQGEDVSVPETSETVPQVSADFLLPGEISEAVSTEEPLPLDDEISQPETEIVVDQLTEEQEGEPKKEPVLIIPVYEDEPLDETENTDIFSAAELLMPVQPEDGPTIIEDEDGGIVILPGEEQPSLLDEEDVEDLSPVNEDNLQLSQDEGEIIVIPEDAMEISPEEETDEQGSSPKYNEDFSEVTVVDKEDGIIQPPYENQDYVFNSFVPLGAEEMSSTDEESGSPVYFDVIDVPAHPQMNGGFLANMPAPGEQLPPFVTSEMVRNQMIKSGVFMPDVNSRFASVNEQADGPFYDDTIFRLTPPDYPTGSYEPEHEVLGVYYVPEGNFPIDIGRYENPEMGNLLINRDAFRPERQFASEVSSAGPIIPSNEFNTNDNIFNAGEFNSDTNPTVMNEEQIQQAEDGFPNTDGAELVIVEPTLDSENSPSQFEDGQIELGKIGTVVVVEDQDMPEDDDEPSIEIIQLDESSVPESMPLEPISTDTERKPNPSFIPEEFMENGGPQIFANDQLAEFMENEATPFVIEETYWVPESGDQHAIIFPEDASARERLPVFPSQFRENDFIPDVEEADSPNYQQYDESSSFRSNPFSESVNVPSFPEQRIMENQPELLYDAPNDEMLFENLDFTLSSDLPQAPREDIIPIYKSDTEYEKFGHLSIPGEFSQTFMYPNFRKRFNRPISYGMPSVFEIGFQQDYQGPNTFPLNFRRSDYGSQVSGPYYIPYSKERTAQNSNQENVYSNSAYMSQNLRQSMPNGPNIFSGLGEEIQIMLSPDGQGMNINTPQNSPSLMNSDSFNQGEEQYDTQVSFVPYESTFNFPSYSQNNRRNFMFPYSQQARRPSFDTYQDYSYNVPAYGRAKQFASSGFYGGQNDNYNRYNYPFPTW